MKLNIITKDYQLKENDSKMIKRKFVEKLDKLLADFEKGVLQASLRIKKGARWGIKVSFNMNLPKKEHIFAKTKKENLVLAITSLRQEVEKQIKKYKEKLQA